MKREKERLIPKHGGYRNIKSFHVAQLVYGVTVRCCDRYIARRSRMHDQMVQGTRSGVQDIAEVARPLQPQRRISQGRPQGRLKQQETVHNVQLVHHVD